MSSSALGLIETRGLVGLIEAADAAAKAAQVRLLGFECLGGGMVSLRFSGEVGAVQAAVQVAVQAARRVGEVLGSHVIPGPHADLAGLLKAPGDSGRPSAPPLSTADLEKLPVSHLRRLARRTAGLELKGREISRANKRTLIAALKGALQGKVRGDSVE